MRVLNESYEDYLKAIYLISKGNKGGWVSNSEISNFLKIKPASVTNMLYKLKSNDLIDWKPRSSIRLTPQGKQVAIQMIKNYKNLKNFFIKILKINDKGLIDELCCGIEHHITPEITKALENLFI